MVSPYQGAKAYAILNKETEEFITESLEEDGGDIKDSPLIQKMNQHSMESKENYIKSIGK